MQDTWLVQKLTKHAKIQCFCIPTRSGIFIFNTQQQSLHHRRRPLRYKIQLKCLHHTYTGGTGWHSYIIMIISHNAIEALVTEAPPVENTIDFTSFLHFRFTRNFRYSPPSARLEIKRALINLSKIMYLSLQFHLFGTVRFVVYFLINISNFSVCLSANIQTMVACTHTQACMHSQTHASMHTNTLYTHTIRLAHSQWKGGKYYKSNSTAGAMRFEANLLGTFYACAITFIAENVWPWKFRSKSRRTTFAIVPFNSENQTL